MAIKLSKMVYAQYISVLLTGLIAGLLYGYDCSVIKGLKNVTDNTYVESFQSINNAIQNSYFFITFLGSMAALLVAAWQAYGMPSRYFFNCLLFAAIVYAIGVIGTTVFFNIPLNEKLAAFKIDKSSGLELSQIRKLFEDSWNKYHRIRTVASFISFAAALLSTLK